MIPRPGDIIIFVDDDTKHRVTDVTFLDGKYICVLEDKKGLQQTIEWGTKDNEALIINGEQL